MTFQPMVIPTTPTLANRSLSDAEPINGVTPSSSLDTRPGAKFRGASVEVHTLASMTPGPFIHRNKHLTNHVFFLPFIFLLPARW
jgi:hypothetical protein